jgi:biotin/methionine sulfoxide reductase
VAAFIPVARLSDMLLNPGAPFAFDGGTHRYPDIRMVWWAGGNPFHHQPDLNRLRRAWARPETVIVQDPFWTATARHADIVLPATTPCERNDFGLAKAEGHLVAMRQAVPPAGGARNDADILRGVAARLGLEAAFTEGRDEMGWIRHLYDATRDAVARAGGALPDFEAFWAAGEARAGLPDAPAPLMAAFRADPGRAPLPTPSGRIELAPDRIAAMALPDCPGLPDWRDPGEWLGGPPGRYPLHLLSPQPARRLHSQFDHSAHSRAGKVAGREPVLLHPADAAARGIRAGDIVRLWNDRGACLAGAVVTDAILPGVVALATGAWYDPDPDTGLCRHGNPNVLTSDLPTSSLGQGSAANSALVQIARLDGPAPPVGAFDPPPVLPADAPFPEGGTACDPPCPGPRNGHP